MAYLNALRTICQCNICKLIVTRFCKLVFGGAVIMYWLLCPQIVVIIKLCLGNIKAGATIFEISHGFRSSSEGTPHPDPLQPKPSREGRLPFENFPLLPEVRMLSPSIPGSR